MSRIRLRRAVHLYICHSFSRFFHHIAYISVLFKFFHCKGRFLQKQREKNYHRESCWIPSHLHVLCRKPAITFSPSPATKNSAGKFIFSIFHKRKLPVSPKNTKKTLNLFAAKVYFMLLRKSHPRLDQFSFTTKS